MRQRNGILVLLVISILISLSGCTFTQIANGPERNSDPMTGTVTPEPKIMANPVPLLCGVETDKRVVSLVFEGYTDDSTMNAIAEVLEEKEIPAVFFLSGITANEHPSTLRKLAGGFEIGNYGMGGGKHLENYSAFENAEKFKLAQEQITQATGKRPTLLRCNNTEYTEDVLRAASAAGLSAAVQPTAYLNHRSFKNADEAYSYALHVLRGSILSIKLGQELDEEEYDDLGERLDERPAIDPKPGIRWEWSSEEEIYASIPELVKWLIEALENFGYEFTDPLSLQRSATELLRKTGELSQEEIKQLDPGEYSLPVTQKPFSSGTEHPAEAKDFDSAVFVGDSVMEGIGEYVNWIRKNEAQFLGSAMFLTDRNATVESLLDTGTEIGDLGEKLAEEKANSVWLCLGFSNPAGYVKESYLAKYRLLIREILEKNPNIRVVVLPVLPKAEGYAGVSNAHRFRLNLMLFKMCREYGLDFVDIASVVRDESGGLKEEYCLDLVTSGSHLNDEGCSAVLNYMTEHFPL